MRNHNSQYLALRIALLVLAGLVGLLIAAIPIVGSIVVDHVAAQTELVMQVVDSIEWIEVPGDCFVMGSALGGPDERPEHQVCLSSFNISKTEITNAHYRACVEDGGCSALSDQRFIGLSDYDRFPVVYITWEQAQAFADWLSDGTEREFRLPSEAQWEFAAKGPENRIYPWGDESNLTSPDIVNLCDENCDEAWRVTYNDGAGKLAPVGQHLNGASWIGVLNMGGNVSEWVVDCYASYDIMLGQPYDPVNLNCESDRDRVVRGGSWLSMEYQIRTSIRNHFPPQGVQDYIGFRVAEKTASVMIVAPTFTPTISPTPNLCGNNRCEPAFGEDLLTCPWDCRCGNSQCDTDWGENEFTCPSDCESSSDNDPKPTKPGNGSTPIVTTEPPPVCNYDGICNGNEDITNCPTDCYCGNKTCDPGETKAGCARDCKKETPVPAVCGNKVCDPGESKDTCPRDCK